MSKARELADVIGTQDTTENVLQGRRNLIINGDMQVAQRGTGFTQTTSSTYTLDRWASAATASTTVNQVAKGTDGNPSNRLRFAGNTGATYAWVAQRIESNNMVSAVGKQVTLSFDMSVNNISSVALNLFSANATNDFSGITLIQSISITPNSSGFHRYSATFNALPTASANGIVVEFAVSNATATTDAFELTNVQLEVGSVATPFEHRSYGEELALCQRYYQRIGAYSNQYPLGFGYGWGTNGVNSAFSIPLGVAMRATPSFAETTAGSLEIKCNGVTAQVSPSSFGISYIAGATTVQLVVTGHTATGDKHSSVLTNRAENETVEFDAEL